jgi:hypothetical protein
LQARVDGLIAELGAVILEKLPELERLLTDAGVSYVIVEPGAGQ